VWRVGVLVVKPLAELDAHRLGIAQFRLGHTVALERFHKGPGDAIALPAIGQCRIGTKLSP
jgi:hypothetical protein